MEAIQFIVTQVLPGATAGAVLVWLARSWITSHELLGLSQSLRLLVVVHCYRAEGRVIRIISARKADADERSIYR